ncbi:MULTISPECIES: single-stranded DNA-binding protein [unclassified Streptomyces]|uniref:single-stranded DNA-binding protein n=1 Tax=unclassified Streptomyces TaxID=2593676 RepID=UPI002DD906F4|nr:MULTISPECIES: single-stranded DNA-binding protein [unclassified Streptomyces]WSB79138.1 single-stranded DNA-binding protein [Streptomyces sp. NBC_01775]WSS12660.1 single-stranded DNA-binding protein [Streptomyces sp. NBC_01186]WSS41445.1 single-stranded DNA-binding protein [Streptomyces sp. NBC_01187]
MNETEVTVSGNVATQVDHWTSPSGVPVARFRLASTVRRFDKRKGSWSDAFTSFYTVWAWRSLATNVASSVARGEPVIVRGQLRIMEDEREGRRYLNADLLASTVGHDLSRGTAAFVRVSRANPELTRLPASAWSVGGSAGGPGEGPALGEADGPGDPGPPGEAFERPETVTAGAPRAASRAVGEDRGGGEGKDGAGEAE